MPLTTNIVSGARALDLALIMHGVGADEKDLAPIVPMLDPEGRYVAVLPRGQYSYGPGAAWYAIDNPGVLAGQVKSSLASLDEVVEGELQRRAMEGSGLLVGGFSQGGSMALTYAFRKDRPYRPAGVMVMSGFLKQIVYGQLDLDLPELDFNDPPPVIIQHGSQDPVVPVEAAQATAAVLADAGVPVWYREYPMQHQISMESINDAAAWLADVRAGKTPTTDVPEINLPPQEAAGPATTADGTVHNVTAASFKREVLEADGPVIVDFWAPWCQPCIQVAPIVEAIARMRKGSYKVVKLNIDEAQQIAQEYQVQSIPLVGLFRNGRLERRSTGVKPRPQLEAELGMIVIP